MTLSDNAGARIIAGAKSLVALQHERGRSRLH
jgi:hypothetical protein